MPSQIQLQIQFQFLAEDLRSICASLRKLVSGINHMTQTISTDTTKVAAALSQHNASNFSVDIRIAFYFIGCVKV